jgi:ribosomal protein S30
VNPTHGGLTPAALDSVVGVRRTLFAAPCERDRLPTHGGLTPAALGNVRLCSGNVVFHSERTTCTRSGWREPAVVPGRECAGRNVISPQKPIADASVNPTHGGLTNAALDSVVGVRRTLFAAPCKRDQLPTHGGLTPAALGNVRLYSANIVFHRERTSCNQERLA